MLLADILDSFRLTESPTGGFRGPNVPIPGYRRLFGGQLLGQTLVAAARTAPTKQVKSIQMFFLAEGDPSEEVTYQVDEVHTGRTFATRMISACQRGRRMLTAIVTLHGEESGLEHQLPPPAVPRPGELAAGGSAGPLPVETRLVDGIDLSGLEVGEPHSNLWMRVPDTMDDALLPHQSVLAYCSDSPMMGTALRPHPGLGLGMDGRIRSAVTSHSIWFHRPFRADEWLLFANSSPSAHGARVFGRGDWYTEGGVLVASCAQEGMIRTE